MSDPITEHEQYVMDRAERALVSNAEAYRLVEERSNSRRLTTDRHVRRRLRRGPAVGVTA